MKKKIQILLIEDDPVITEFLRTGLGYEGYVVSVVGTGNDALDMLRDSPFHLIILDIMLPDMDGFDVCRRIRNREAKIPVLMLTVRKEVVDRVRGLDSGADDYLTKPFSFDELLARIRALLRRAGNIRENDRVISGTLILDTGTREVRRNGRQVELTPTEFNLLKLFMRHPDRVFTRETLLNRVLGYTYDGGTNVIDVHVNHLRKKLGDRPPVLIRTIYGVGYAFHPDGP